MSFVKIKKSLKEKYRKVTKVLFADISTETTNDNIRSDIQIKFNGVFKIIQIEYEGKVKKVSVNTNFLYFHNKKSRKIIISNPRKIRVKDSVDCQYIGVINKFKVVKIYNWGWHYIAPSIKTPSHIQERIGLNENIISTSTDKFKGVY